MCQECNNMATTIHFRWYALCDNSLTNSHESSSDPTMLSVQLDFLGSNAVSTNSKKWISQPRSWSISLISWQEGCALYHKQNQTPCHPTQGKGFNWITAWLWVKNHINSKLQFSHPPHHGCYIQSSPGHFHTPCYGHQGECLHHTINENSKQSFSIYPTEKIDREKVSQLCDPVQSSPKTGWEMQHFSPRGCKKPKRYPNARNIQFLNLKNIQICLTKSGEVKPSPSEKTFYVQTLYNMNSSDNLV